MAFIHRIIGYGKFSEQELLRRLSVGEHGAFREIYERYWQKLLTVAIYKIGTKEDAEEVVQDIFVSLWNRRAEVTITHIEPYLLRATNYKVIDVLRRKIRENVKMDLSEIDVAIEATDTLTVEEFITMLNKSIDKLPPKTKEIFQLSRLENQTNQEIADKTDLTVKAVEYHMTKALKQLKSDLAIFMP